MRARRRLLVLGAAALFAAVLLSAPVAHADVAPDPRTLPGPAVGQARVLPPDPAVDAGLQTITQAALAFLVPLGLTLVIEVPIVALAGRGDPSAILAGVFVNTLTNPIVVGVYAAVALIANVEMALAALLLLEIGAVVAESLLYGGVLGWSHRKAARVSVVANVASFGLGVVVLWGAGARPG